MSRRILILFIGNILLLIIGVMLLDTIGIIDYRSYLYENVPFVRNYLVQKLEDPNLVEKENLLRYKQELDYLKKVLDERERDLSNREKEIAVKEQELQEKLSMVDEMKATLEKQQQIFKDQDAKVTKLANYISSLPPDDAVKILANMDDDTIVDVLLKMDQIAERQGLQSLSSFLLSKLPSDRAARIGEKILRR
ncbi:MAG: periplasmic-type flagellar collar protein FlbB [Brevinematia bacterium]